MKMTFAQKNLMIFFIVLFPLLAWSNADEIAVANAYHTWCKTLGEAKGNAAEIVKLYAPNALLLPTLSPTILVNHQGSMNAYFTSLTSHPHLLCKTNKLITRLYGTMAINAGLYTFSYTEAGKTIVLPARFTFVYEKLHNQWLIVNHHSSKLP